VSSDIFLLSQSSAQNDLSLVVPASTATAIIEALKRDFAAEIACANSEQTIFEVPVALLTVVGEKLQGSPTALVRLLSALGRESISILAVATGPTDCKISLVVTRTDLRLALIAAHREFEVPPVHLASLPPVVQPALWRTPVSQPHSDAD
jgi:aspartokinase